MFISKWIGLLVCLLLCICFIDVANGKRKRSKTSVVTKDKELGQVRVLLLASGYPWQYGPYQNQQALLGVELVNRGFDVYWNSAFRQLGGVTKVHTPLEVIKSDDQINKPPTPQGKQLERANLFSYIGVLLPPAFQKLGRGKLFVLFFLFSDLLKYIILIIFFFFFMNYFKCMIFEVFSTF
jgi:hypothetical protein